MGRPSKHADALRSAFEEAEPSLSIPQFCAAEGISTTFYYCHVRPHGLVNEMRLPGSKMVRISPEERKRYHERVEARAKEVEAKLERERHAAQSRRSAKISAEGPNHVSKQKKAAAAKRRRQPEHAR